MTTPTPKKQSKLAALWPAERKITLVLEGLRRRRPVTTLCREAGISPKIYYQWQHQAIDAARVGLDHPDVERQLQQLEAENASLRQQVRVFQDLCIAD